MNGFEYYISGYFNSHRNAFNYSITKESYDELSREGVDKLIKRDYITFKRSWSVADKEEMGQGIVKGSDISSLNLYKKPR
ncbi:hypothetical protein [Bacillus sp. AG4(2022)]|uniref:hypothetical protein n=1 Tax=Bacillus sp. AG4(2022) TaxID=2962594 RepID=UPI0028818E99|nr:hypothetical protein [Bacillus sp. AG4(2022)]MDT0160351.1 hypothetical protein [Bacillus sp. AG4(2022)]